MTDQHRSVDAQYRGSAYRFVIEFVEIAVFQTVVQGHRIDAFHLFDDRIADEPVAYHHVGHFTGKQVFGFDVADEIEIVAVFHHLVGGFGLLVALLLLFSDVQQGDARVFLVHDPLRIQVADRTVLAQHFGLAIHVQSDVEEHHFATVDGRDDRRDGRADDSFDLLDGAHTADHHRPGAAGARETVDFLFHQVTEADRDAGIGFLAECLRRIVSHADNLGCRYDFERVGRAVLARQNLLDPDFVSEQDDFAVPADEAGRFDGTRHHRLRSIISAHCVNSYFRHTVMTLGLYSAFFSIAKRPL